MKDGALALDIPSQMVFQLQLTKRQDAVPLTRDYIYAPQQPMEARIEQAAE